MEIGNASNFEFMCINADDSFSNGLMAAQGSQDALIFLQQQWAISNYQLEGEEQVESFEKLIENAEKYVSVYPDNAPILTWSGIIKSTFAGVKGGLGALKYAKSAKVDLEKSLAVDDEALMGSAYTSLGTLYFKVPGWPIGFGNDEKAEELLTKALTLNPDGIDSNYFYADYLLSKSDYAKAKHHLLKAQQAAPRSGREMADKGRQKEVQVALENVEKNLAN